MATWSSARGAGTAAAAESDPAVQARSNCPCELGAAMANMPAAATRAKTSLVILIATSSSLRMEVASRSVILLHPFGERTRGDAIPPKPYAANCRCIHGIGNMAKRLDAFVLAGNYRSVEWLRKTRGASG